MSGAPHRALARLWYLQAAKLPNADDWTIMDPQLAVLRRSGIAPSLGFSACDGKAPNLPGKP
jgi:hypothetical protein